MTGVLLKRIIGNLNANPWMEAGITDWLAQGGATIARSTAQAHEGAASLLLTPPGGVATVGTATIAKYPVVAGQSYVVSAWVYLPNAWTDIRACIDWADSSGAFTTTGLGVASSVGAGAWTFLTQTLVAPVGAAYAQPRVRLGGTPPATILVYADEIMLTKPGAYLDARLAVEAAFGADLAAADPGTWPWADITTDVMYASGKVSISPMGRGDETAKAQPAGCKLRLLNTTGKYSKNLPTSPYWPNVRRNTPLRVTVQRTATPSIRSLSTVSSGTAGSFAVAAPAGVVAGDLVLAFHTADASFLGDLDKPSGANWRLLTEVGTTTTGGGVTVGYLATRVWYYRATGAAPASYTFTQGNVANGVVTIAALKDVGLYTIRATTQSPAVSGISFTTPTSNPLRSDDLELRWAAGSSLAGVVGVTWTPPAGLVEQSDWQSGNYTSATLAARTTGSTAQTAVKIFTCSSSALDWGHGVTVNVSNVNIRFQGQANGFVPSWDTSAKVAVVDLSASGKLRQLTQGKTPLRSALYRASVAVAPFGYWPLEDGASSTQGASGLPGGTPMTVNRPSGSVTNPVPANSPLHVFAKTDSTAGSDKIVYLGDSYLRADLAGTNATAWRVDWIGRYDAYSTGAFTTEMLRVYADKSPDHKQWRVAADNVDLYVYFFSESTGEVVITTTGHQIYDGRPHHFGLVVNQNGGNIDVHLYMDGQQIGLGSYVGKTLTAMTGIQAGSEDNYLETAAPKPSVGHITVWDMDPPGVDLGPAAGGYVGEAVTARLARLCAEQGVPIEIRGSSDTAMGAQGIAAFVDLLRECESTDDGVLYDGVGSGLAYAARAVRYNAAAALTADMAGDPPQLGDPFAPVDDDQRNRNLIKATRKGGSSAIYEDDFSPLGTQAIGVYDAEVTINAAADDGLYFRAAWEVHKGTVNEPYRYPRLNLDLGAVPAIIDDWLFADVSSRIDAINVAVKTTQHPPGDINLLLEGWAEQLSPFDWTAAGNCSPFEPWRVGVIEGGGDTVLRIDSGSSTLAAGVAAGATSISVATTNPVELWSTAPGDYPRAVDVGGVRVNVTAVAGAVSPQTFTVDPAPYPLTGGAQVKLWRPPTIAL